MSAQPNPAPAHLTPTVLTDNPATGPKTDDGKRIVSRNATTHGLGTREVVLPHLGEDPADYAALRAELTAQFQPESEMERHYVEKIVAASWRLRRLQRWQAQLFNDPALTLEQGVQHLDSVMRHETALHRQIDQSVKMLERERPKRSAQQRGAEESSRTEGEKGGDSPLALVLNKPQKCQNKPLGKAQAAQTPKPEHFFPPLLFGAQRKPEEKPFWKAALFDSGRGEWGF